MKTQCTNTWSSTIQMRSLDLYLKPRSFSKMSARTRSMMECASTTHHRLLATSWIPELNMNKEALQEYLWLMVSEKELESKEEELPDDNCLQGLAATPIHTQSQLLALCTRHPRCGALPPLPRFNLLYVLPCGINNMSLGSAACFFILLPAVGAPLFV